MKIGVLVFSGPVLVVVAKNGAGPGGWLPFRAGGRGGGGGADGTLQVAVDPGTPADRQGCSHIFLADPRKLATGVTGVGNRVVWGGAVNKKHRFAIKHRVI